VLNSFIEARNLYQRLQRGTSKLDPYSLKLDALAYEKRDLWECMNQGGCDEDLDDGGIWLG